MGQRESLDPFLQRGDIIGKVATFLNRMSDAPTAAFPFNLMLACVAALTSYYLVEKPALRLRRRLEASWHRPVTGATKWFTRTSAVR